MTLVYLNDVSEIAVALPERATATHYHFKFTNDYNYEVFTVELEDVSDYKERYSLFNVDADAVGFTEEGDYTCEIYEYTTVVGDKVKEIFVKVL